MYLILYLSETDGNAILAFHWVFRNPYLSSLARDVQASIISSVKNPTASKYCKSFNKWLQWCANFTEISAFLVAPSSLALYMQHLMKSSDARFSSVQTIFFAMKWIHKLVDSACFTESSLIKLILESAKRRCQSQAD